jgi:hypothetical protein
MEQNSVLLKHLVGHRYLVVVAHPEIHWRSVESEQGTRLPAPEIVLSRTGIVKSSYNNYSRSCE